MSAATGPKLQSQHRAWWHGIDAWRLGHITNVDRIKPRNILCTPNSRPESASHRPPTRLSLGNGRTTYVPPLLPVHIFGRGRSDQFVLNQYVTEHAAGRLSQCSSHTMEIGFVLSLPFVDGYKILSDIHSIQHCAEKFSQNPSFTTTIFFSICTLDLKFFS